MKFCEKNVLCEKGDEITRFDGTLRSWEGKADTLHLFLLHPCIYSVFDKLNYN
jgi:hypothetical protein